MQRWVEDKVGAAEDAGEDAAVAGDRDAWVARKLPDPVATAFARAVDIKCRMRSGGRATTCRVQSAAPR